MILLFVLGSLLLFSQAKPRPKAQIGLTYNYKPPATSYGVPSETVNVNSGDYRYSTTTVSPFEAYVTSTLPPLLGVTNSGLQNTFSTSTVSPLIVSKGLSTDYEVPIHDFTTFSNRGNIPLSNNDFANTVFTQQINSNQNVNPASITFSVSGDNGLISNQNLASGISSLSIQNPAQSIEFENGQTGGESIENNEPQIEVSRHLYFFSSPEDITAPRQRINLPQTPTKQNVKVLFIKTPSVVTPPPIIVPAQKQNEDKTVVYVLVKKPEEPAPIEIETPPPTPPSKPEVYFIKYNTEQEAEEAVARIQKHKQQYDDARNIHNKISFSPNVNINAIPSLSSFNLGNRFQGISVSNSGELDEINPSIYSGVITTEIPIQSRPVTGHIVSSLSGLPESSYRSSVSFDAEPKPFVSTSDDHSEANHSTTETNTYTTESVRALSESFGGSNNAPSESETSNSPVISTSRVNGIFNDVIPHSSYGVPSKRGIHNKFNYKSNL